MDELFPLNAPHSRLISFVKDRPSHDKRYVIDSSMLQNKLGWRPEVDLNSGIKETVKWYINNKKCCEYMMKNGIYKGERIGI